MLQTNFLSVCFGRMDLCYVNAAEVVEESRNNVEEGKGLYKEEDLWVDRLR